MTINFDNLETRSAATLTNHTTATVTLQYMCSKVNIVWTITPNADLTSFTLTDAYIMNVPSFTDCLSFGTENSVVHHSFY